jgi:hypothetical protein
MWDSRGEVRWCGLSKAWNGGEGYDLHGSWLVMLESAKDLILGVDTPGQHMGSVPCTDEWEMAWSFSQAHMVQEGPWYRDYPGKS